MQTNEEKKKSLACESAKKTMVLFLTMRHAREERYRFF